MIIQNDCYRYHIVIIFSNNKWRLINQNLSLYSFNLNVWMDNYLCVSYSMVFNGLNSKQYITYSENANVILLILLFASLIIDTQDIRFQWKILHYQIFVDLSISMPVLTNITLCVVVLQIDWFVSNETMKLFMIVSNCLVKNNVSSQMITISRYNVKQIDCFILAGIISLSI